MVLTGLDEVITNLNKEIAKIKGDVGNGLYAAGLFIENKSNEVTPQRTGNLVNTSFTKRSMLMGSPVVNVGYTAEYAAFVHEMPTSYNYYKPNTGPKFLEKAVKNNIPRILKIVQDRAKI